MITAYVAGRGWVTSWSEVKSVHGGIGKWAYERPATDDEVFVAQMDGCIKCPECKTKNVQYFNPFCDDVFICKNCKYVFSLTESGIAI